MHQINNVDLNLLKSLHALLQEQHVGRAASRLGVTQPAMSHALSRLRGLFDDPLFVRSGQGIVATPRALRIGEQLPNLMVEISELVKPESFDPSQSHGNFRIATHDFIAATYLTNQLRNIRKIAPGLSFDIGALNDDSFNQLENREVDLVLGAGLNAKSTYRQTAFAEEPLVCVLSSEHPALSDWNIPSVFRYPHVRLSMIAPRDDVVEQYANKHPSLRRHVGLETSSLQMQSPLVEGTNLIAFVPETIAKSAAAS